MVKKKSVEPEMHRTMILLPEELWIEAKVRAARERKNAQDVIREALEAWLSKKGGPR